MSYLTLHHIHKAWGDKTALRDISFSVREGEFVALLGPSGCGKTTLLRTLAGLDQADSGTIRLRGEPVEHLPPAQRQLSMVFQSYALFPHLSVRENLLFGLRARHEEKRHFASRLAEVSALLELDTLLDRLPAQLSGGQQRWVALGRAVIARRRLCLMDEPLSNLDARLRQTMRREIRTLQQRLGLTVLYVTHDQLEAMSMADRVILLHEGAIVQHDSPENLYHDPASSFAARFIGAPPMNLLPLRRRGGWHCLGHQPICADDGQTALTLGLRAENLTLTALGAGKTDARISAVEYMGADTWLQCALECGGELTVSMSGLRRVSPGSAVGLSWPRQAQYLFHRDSGARRRDAEQPFLPRVALHAAH